MMSHHSTEEEQPTRRMHDEFLNKQKEHHPSGRVGNDDQGEAAFAIAADVEMGIVRIHFAKPMTWLGLGIDEAVAMRDCLTSKIDELKEAKK